MVCADETQKIYFPIGFIGSRVQAQTQSIQESKHPDWNLVLEGIFNIIGHDISFHRAFNLLLPLFPAAHLKGYIVYFEI